MNLPLTLRFARPALLAIALCAALLGCAGTTPADYASATPVLDLRQYFNGPLVAHGLVTDRSGKVMQRFRVDLVGTWVGDTGTLDEAFFYADGKRQHRVWTITRSAEGRWIGRAADVVGQADGSSAGNALNWRYTLRVPVGGTDWDLQFDDWMYLIDERVMINRAVMRKFGFTLGEVLLSFQRPAP